MDAPATDQPKLTPQQRLRHGPIVPTLLALSAPNLVALCSSAIITIAETSYVGRLGVASLAGVALVFPVIMLNQMLSAGAMGGAISGAVSRALGVDDHARAEALALCAAAIGVVAGVSLGAIVLLFGPAIFAALGGQGAALEQAVAYSNVAALGILAIWLSNSLASVARGSGNMGAPAMIILGAGVLQILIGGALGLGIGPFPRWGVAGVATGQVVGFTCAALALIFLLQQPSSRVRLRFDPSLLSGPRFMDILRQGLIAALSPIQSVATVMILTAFVARFGTEALAGYGIGTRLEFLLIPIAFSVGIACIPMVGTAIGAGDIARARRVTWIAGAMAAGAVGLLGVVVIIFPDVWARMFSSDERVLAVTRDYLRIAGFGFPFFGLGLALYFAAQGAGRVSGPIAAQTLRLLVIIIGGWLLVRADAPLTSMFVLVAFSMATLGIGAAAAIKFTPWTARH